MNIEVDSINASNYAYCHFNMQALLATIIVDQLEASANIALLKTQIDAALAANDKKLFMDLTTRLNALL